MATQGPPSPVARLVLGMLCIAGGLVPMLAAFDLGPLDHSAINGPRWLGFLAGAIFVAGGIALLLGERLRHSVLFHGLVALVIGAFAAIASWIAFGPGSRACEIVTAGVLFASAWADEIACRAGFGIGAVLLDGFVLWMIAGSLRTIFGPGALPTAIEKLGVAVIVLALAPILAPMLLFGIGKVFIKGFATWRATGRWPRNDAFIQRMKARRNAKP
jgi:hypothetical protein